MPSPDWTDSVNRDLFNDEFESPLWSHQCRSSNDLGMKYTKCPVLQTTHLLSTSNMSQSSSNELAITVKFEMDTNQAAEHLQLNN